MRVFVAVVPPDDVVDHLDGFLAPRRAAAPFRWTRPEQFHLTLAFMEAVPEVRIDAYVDRLAEVLDDLPVAEVALAGAVVFPNVTEGRVLAAGLDGDVDVLERMAVRCRNAAVASGIEVDGQRFRPHLTLARTGGHPTEMTNWVRLLDDYRGPSWSVESVAVIASHLGEGPRRTPRHETLAEILFGG